MSAVGIAPKRQREGREAVREAVEVGVFKAVHKLGRGAEEEVLVCVEGKCGLHRITTPDNVGVSNGGVVAGR